MILQDLLQVGERVGSYLKDLLNFYLAPSSYFRSVASESIHRTVFRLVMYAVLFTLLEVSIFSLVLPQVPTGPFFLAGATIFELAFSVLYIPAFILVTKFLRFEAPVKTAVAYALTFRFAYFLVPILLYALFLLTEDYGYALLRGVSVWMFLLGYCLMLPLTLAQGVRKRAIASGISVAACVLVVSGFVAILGESSTPRDRAVEGSIFFDPIGSEVDRAQVRFDRDTSLQRVVTEIQFLVQGKDSLTRTPPQEVQHRLAMLREGWARADSTFRQRIDRTDQELRTRADSAKFATTKDLIDLRRAQLSKERVVLNTIDQYVRQPTISNFVAVIRSDVTLINSETTGHQSRIEHLQVRIKLINLGLLIYRSGEEELLKP